MNDATRAVVTYSELLVRVQMSKVSAQSGVADR
jgi:hypothetical protein